VSNTADFQRVLGGLRPSGHRIHRQPQTVLPSACPLCVSERLARLPVAEALRPFTNGWGVLDLDLAMPELAMQIAAGTAPDFLS
jgi:hypothetical protein